MPQVFSNGQKVFLTYIINESDAKSGAFTHRLAESSSEMYFPMALVEFTGNTFRFGMANDEVFN